MSDVVGFGWKGFNEKRGKFDFNGFDCSYLGAFNRGLRRGDNGEDDV